MASANAKRAIQKILLHEGGFVNHPSDPGGATNKGITIATFRRFIKPAGTIEDLKALTTEQAFLIYKRQYWDAVSGDLLPAGLDYAVADFAVNSGPARAAKFLQRILGVSIDGVIGPATLAKADSRSAKEVAMALCDNRLAWMQTLNTWGTFGRGWSKRVADVRATAVEWAAIERKPFWWRFVPWSLFKRWSA